MEWRGGMVPHFGLSNSKVKETPTEDYHRPPLRKIDKDWNQLMCREPASILAADLLGRCYLHSLFSS